MTKILIIHTFGMGDMIMALPMIEMISQEIPKAIIDILITDKSAVFPVKNNPNIHEIITSDYKSGNLLKTIIRLRKLKYDISFVTSISFKSNTIKLSIFSYLIQAKKRYGELLKIIYPFYTKYIKSTMGLHRVQSNLNLLTLFTHRTYNIPSIQPKIYLNESAISYAKDFFEKHFKKTKKIIAIHPGSNPKGKHRRWNKEYFVELINLIRKNKPYFEFLIIAGPGEIEEGDYITKATEIAMINNCTLDQVAAILARCDVLINTDSGIGHIASAFETKIFTIFGPGDYRKTSPYSKNTNIISNNVSCSPCLYPHKNCGLICLKGLTPEIIFNQIKEQI